MRTLNSAGNFTHFISTSWKVDNLVEREKVLHAMAKEDTLIRLLNRRADDPAIHWGGEEFLVLVAAPLPAAEMLAERLRAGIAALADAEVGPVTLSFGVAEARPDESLTQLLAGLMRRCTAQRTAGAIGSVVPELTPPGRFERDL